MQEGGGIFSAFPGNTDVPKREGIPDVGILMSRCSNDYFNPDAMDKVSAALTCGAADKDKPAARMLPKGTSGIRCRGKEEKDKRQRKKTKKKDKEKGRRKRQKTKDKNAALKYRERNEEKGRRKKRQDLRCFFYSLVLQGRRGQISVATSCIARERRNTHFAVEHRDFPLIIETIDTLETPEIPEIPEVLYKTN